MSTATLEMETPAEARRERRTAAAKPLDLPVVYGAHRFTSQDGWRWPQDMHAGWMAWMRFDEKLTFIIPGDAPEVPDNTDAYEKYVRQHVWYITGQGAIYYVPFPHDRSHAVGTMFERDDLGTVQVISREVAAAMFAAATS